MITAELNQLSKVGAAFEKGIESWGFCQPPGARDEQKAEDAMTEEEGQEAREKQRREAK